MNIVLVAAGTRVPAWVQAGYESFAKRLPRECALALREVPVEKRGKGAQGAGARHLVAREGERMLEAIPRSARIVAMDERGTCFNTRQLAAELEKWLAGGRDVAVLIGGPDGLSPACVERADMRWSLSPLTLPHAMVRVIVAEQIYRAWSLLRGHPYHRD